MPSSHAASVADWLSAQPDSWREQVRYVAIDLCSTFRAAVHRALPHAAVVVDCFHIAQLAQRHLADLRRRLTWRQHGRLWGSKTRIVVPLWSPSPSGTGSPGP
ncbi:transposase [Actinacidiphila oryziradicis]|uniref:transposase n=1 Tax=Actinacidiphila oryziradicis TaxID=2571141 RepID=UPI0038991DA3